MQDMLVSILVLCFNQQETILQTLLSVASQKTDFSYEVLIGDDSSSDNTRMICESFSSPMSNCTVRLYPKTENVGLLENYQRLVNDAKGIYIACCAGDDYWTDLEKIQKQSDFLQKNEEYGLVYTKLSVFDEKNKIFMDPYRGEHPPEGAIFDQLLRGNFIGALSTMYRKDVAIQAIEEGLFKRGFLMEDYPLWLYISKRNKTKLLLENMVVWRKLEESISNSNNLNKQFDFELSVIDVQLYYAKKYNKMHIVKDCLHYCLRKKLHQAYIEENGRRAKALFKRISQVEKASLADRMMMMGALYPQIKPFFTLLKKIKDKIKGK